MKLFNLETETFLTSNNDIITIKEIFGYSFKSLDLPLIALGISEESVVTMNVALFHQTESTGEFITGYEAEDFSFKRDSLKSFGISSSAKISGISNDGKILIKDGSDFAIISIL